MKFIYNSTYPEEYFSDIEKAKIYYSIDICDNGSKEYMLELQHASTFEEIAEAYNKYTDILSNGTELKVKEI